jgi:hypothetical protein
MFNQKVIGGKPMVVFSQFELGFCILILLIALFDIYERLFFNLLHTVPNTTWKLLYFKLAIRPGFARVHS